MDAPAPRPPSIPRSSPPARTALERAVRAVPAPAGRQLLAVLRREDPRVRGWDPEAVLVVDVRAGRAGANRSRAREARVASTLAAATAEAVEVREDARRAWADDVTWWEARRRGAHLDPEATAGVADLRAALAVHVRCALGTPHRPRSLALWDAALSALLLASLRSAERDPRARDAVSDYLLLTAAFDGSDDRAADWHEPTGAPWARAWRGLDPPLRDRVVDAMAIRADQAVPDRNARLLLACRGTMVCERIARRLWIADPTSDLGRELALWQLEHDAIAGLASLTRAGVRAWTAAADATQLEVLASRLALEPGAVGIAVRGAAIDAGRSRERSDGRTRALLDDAVREAAAGRAAHTARALRSWFARPASDADARRVIADGARALAAVEGALSADPALASLAAAYWATALRPAYRRLLPRSGGRRLVAVERLEYHVARLAARLRDAGEPVVAHALWDDLSPDARHDLTAPYLAGRAVERAQPSRATSPV